MGEKVRLNKWRTQLREESHARLMGGGKEKPIALSLASHRHAAKVPEPDSARRTYSHTTQNGRGAVSRMGPILVIPTTRARVRAYSIYI